VRWRKTDFGSKEFERKKNIGEQCELQRMKRRDEGRMRKSNLDR